MSYILDALRRADSERERGAVPGLHAQSSHPGLGVLVGDDDARRWSWPMLGAALAALLLLALLGWRMLSKPEAEPVAAVRSEAAPGRAPTTPAVPASATAAAAEAAPVAAAPSAKSTAPVAANTPVPAATTVARPRPSSRATASAAAAMPSPTAPSTQTAPTTPSTTPRRAIASTSPQAPTAASAVAAAGASTAASAPRIYTPAELPADVRRQLPALAIGGSMYSENAANRMLIVNGQLLHEGDKLAPDLELEQIKLKSAVFRFKTYRLGVGY